MQVELAHGGRRSSSSDRRGGYGGGSFGSGRGRPTISRHSEFRGRTNCPINYRTVSSQCSFCTTLYIDVVDVLINTTLPLYNMNTIWSMCCSYCSWSSIISFMARFEGKRLKKQSVLSTDKFLSALAQLLQQKIHFRIRCGKLVMCPLLKYFVTETV